MKHDAFPRAGMLFYRARCRCGWKGPRRWKRVTADADAEEHFIKGRR